MVTPAPLVASGAHADPPRPQSDPDDAFMFWGLASGEVDPRGFEFEHVLRGHPDAERVGARRAARGDRDLARTRTRSCRTATSCCRTARRMGSGYGPIVVAREELSRGRPARASRSPCPGELTTAFLVLRMCLGDFRYREVPFDQIIDEVQSGRADAGLLIHEGQLTYEARRAAEGRRPRRVVAARDRACRCRSARTSRGATSAPRRCSSSPTCSRESIQRRARQPRARRWSTRCSSAAASTPSWPTASSACT